MLRGIFGSGGGAAIGGGGTSSPSTIPRWTGPSTLGDSGITDNGTVIGVANGARTLLFNLVQVSGNQVNTPGAGELAIQYATSKNTVIYNGSSPALFVNGTTGNVGIGTASPASRLDVAGTITCDDAGTGLKLPATPGNTDPNTLDAYEDGGTAGTGGKTWTPTDTSGAGLTLTVTKAQYIRIGKQITFAFELTYPVTADATNAAISVPVTGITNWAASGVVYINTLGLRMWMISGGNLYFYTTAGIRMTNAQLSGLAVYGGSSYIAA